MQTLELIILVVTLSILAELTYLLSRQTGQSLRRRAARSVLVDTSALIDGRLLSVAETGFIGDTLIIPRSVIGELQFLADHADHEKRARARHGLDVVAALQASDKVEVEILQDGSKAEEGVDERLLTLAKKHGALICTLDFNLSKVATVENIRVLNLNELAQHIRMAYLPGERMKLELVQKGQDGHQAVGYLTDGTMVVVEHASKQLGQVVEIEVIRSLQTAAGKMMFGRLLEQKQPTKPVAKPLGKRPAHTKPVVVPPTPSAPVAPAPAPTPTFSTESRAPAPKRTPSRRRRGGSRQQQGTAPAPRDTVGTTGEAAAPQRSSSRTKRPRTQSDREASLIDLVEKQSR